jgi:hypothetical protein
MVLTHTFPICKQIIQCIGISQLSPTMRINTIQEKELKGERRLSYPCVSILFEIYLMCSYLYHCDV